MIANRREAGRRRGFDLLGVTVGGMNACRGSGANGTDDAMVGLGGGACGVGMLGGGSDGGGKPTLMAERSALDRRDLSLPGHPRRQG